MSQRCGGGEEQPQPWRERRGSTVDEWGPSRAETQSVGGGGGGARARARVCVCVCVYEIEKENL